MRLLPSEQKARVEAAKKTFREVGRLSINEPCNCGGQIRHNNGGNYHQEIELAMDSELVFVKYGSTYEEDMAEWEPCDNWEAVVEEHADWL